MEAQLRRFQVQFCLLYLLALCPTHAHLPIFFYCMSVLLNKSFLTIILSIIEKVDSPLQIISVEKIVFNSFSVGKDCFFLPDVATYIKVIDKIQELAE